MSTPKVLVDEILSGGTKRDVRRRSKHTMASIWLHSHALGIHTHAKGAPLGFYTTPGRDRTHTHSENGDGNSLPNTPRNDGENTHTRERQIGAQLSDIFTQLGLSQHQWYKRSNLHRKESPTLLRFGKQKLHTQKKLTQVEQQQKGGELGKMDTAIAFGTAKNPHLLCLSAPF